MHLKTPQFFFLLFFVCPFLSSGQTNLKGLNDTLFFSSGSGYTTIKLDVANTGSKFACCDIKVGIYFGTNESLIPSYHIFDIAVDLALKEKDTVSIDTNFNFCDSTFLSTLPPVMQAGDPIYIGYSIDPHEKITESDENDNSGVFKQIPVYSCIVGIKNIDVESSQIFPNPVNDWLHLKSMHLLPESHIIIMNASGQRFYPMTNSNDDDEILISTDQLIDGIYFLLLQNSAGEMQAVKMFVKKK